MKKINITLATCLLAFTNSMVAADVVIIDNFSIVPGATKNVNISLVNESEYVAFQFDLYLPDSLTVESYSADRSRIPESTTLSMSRQQDGSYRFVTMAINGDTIAGTSGTIVTLNVRAHAEMAFGERTGYFRKVKLSTSNATGPTYNEMAFPVTLERPRFAIRYLVDGETYHVDSVGYGLAITPLAAPTREGYTFSGWSEIPSTMPANDVEIIGSFSVNYYNLVYKVDGDIYKTLTVEYGSSITPEPEATKEGYTFSGWSEIPSTMPSNDVEISGTFSVNAYNLIYMVDGETYKTMSLDYGSSITAEQAPVKEGYTFSGWSEIPSTMPASDVEITGTFSVNSYNLVYIVDGETYKTLAVEYGTSITPEPEPAKEGSTFSGWSGVPSTMPARDVEITGSFDTNSYKLIYKLDGEIYKSSIVKYGREITAEPAPVRDGYTFSGWSEIPSTMPANDVEISGTFSVNAYDLVYIVDGETYKTMSLDYGSSITAEQAPVKEGYTFSGWSEIPSTMPANDVEISGTFSVNSYNLVYIVDGETYKTLAVEYSTSITPESEPTKEGYTFSGWSEIPSTMPSTDVEITGTFSVNSYNLVYKVDGSTYKTMSVVYGSEIIPEVSPIKEGYTFSGWSDIPATMPSSDVEISGTFSVNSYNLVYIVDGETYKSLSVEYGTSITPESEPTKEGYTFSGWSEIPASMPSSDVEISGTFSVNSYNLVYIVDGETYKSLSVEYGTSITPESEPTKEGYTFSGWSGIPATMPSSDVEITGTFSFNSYNLVYIVDGEIYKSLSVEYGDSITVESKPTKEGYTFSGWSNIPATMPAEDVEITGLFRINMYSITYLVDDTLYCQDSVEYGALITLIEEPLHEGLTFSGWIGTFETMPSHDVVISGTFTPNVYQLVVMVDDEVVYSDSIVYGTRLSDYVDLITQQGIDITQWEWYDKIETISMPAHDVIINAVLSAVRPIVSDLDNDVIYDLNGRVIKVDDILTLPSGIYIRNGRKIVIQ